MCVSAEHPARRVACGLEIVCANERFYQNMYASERSIGTYTTECQG